VTTVDVRLSRPVLDGKAQSLLPSLVWSDNRSGRDRAHCRTLVLESRWPILSEISGYTGTGC